MEQLTEREFKIFEEAVWKRFESLENRVSNLGSSLRHEFALFRQEVDKRFADMLQQFESFRADVNSRLNTMEARFGRMEERLDRMEERLDRMNERLLSMMKWMVASILGMGTLIAALITVFNFLK